MYYDYHKFDGGSLKLDQFFNLADQLSDGNFYLIKDDGQTQKIIQLIKINKI